MLGLAGSDRLPQGCIAEADGRRKHGKGAKLALFGNFFPTVGLWLFDPWARFQVVGNSP